MIVEDRADTRRLIKKVLGREGTYFVECSDGREAIAAYVAERPDVVLMDIEMPILDGIAATREIIAADPSARIIILSSHDQAALRSAAKDAGAADYVLKENLFSILKQLSRHAFLSGPDVSD